MRVGDFIVCAGERPIASGRRIVEFARGDSLQFTIRRGCCLPSAKIRKVERNLAALQLVTTCVDGVLGENRVKCDGTPNEVVVTGDVVSSLRCDASASACVPKAMQLDRDAAPTPYPVPCAAASNVRPDDLAPSGQVRSDQVMTGRHCPGGCIGTGGLGPQATDDDSWWA